MNNLTDHINELKAAEAFSRQAPIFDRLYDPDVIVAYKRERVHRHVLGFLPQPGELLELNCGTGTDAIFFAGRGHRVHATDIAPGMLRRLKRKAAAAGLRSRISTECCSFTQLHLLKSRGPYDHIFSNFGGLNCTEELPRVLQAFSPLLKPGGKVTLVIISQFCLWETLLLFRGKWKTAFRRFFSRRGRQARVEGKTFRCYYYSPGFVEAQLREEFDVLALEGLCTIVPPSYIEGFAYKYPGLFNRLCRLEARWKDRWPWRACGDYFIITLQKKGPAAPR